MLSDNGFVNRGSVLGNSDASSRFRNYSGSFFNSSSRFLLQPSDWLLQPLLHRVKFVFQYSNMSRVRWEGTDQFECQIFVSCSQFWLLLIAKSKLDPLNSFQKIGFYMVEISPIQKQKPGF